MAVEALLYVWEKCIFWYAIRVMALHKCFSGFLILQSLRLLHRVRE